MCVVGLRKQNVWTNLHLFLESVGDMLICSLIGLIKSSDAERKPPSSSSLPPLSLLLSLSATLLQKKKLNKDAGSACFFNALHGETPS